MTRTRWAGCVVAIAGGVLAVSSSMTFLALAGYHAYFAEAPDCVGLNDCYYQAVEEGRVVSPSLIDVVASVALVAIAVASVVGAVACAKGWFG